MEHTVLLNVFVIPNSHEMQEYITRMSFLFIFLSFYHCLFIMLETFMKTNNFQSIIFLAVATMKKLSRRHMVSNIVIPFHVIPL